MNREVHFIFRVYSIKGGVFFKHFLFFSFMIHGGFFFRGLPLAVVLVVVYVAIG